MTPKNLCWSSWPCASSFTLFGLALIGRTLVPSLHASDRIEATLLDFGLNHPDNFHAEMNRQMNWRPNLNTNVFGHYAANGLIPETAWLRNLTAFAEFQTTWFESDTTPGLESDIHKFFVGASVLTWWDIDVALLYSRSSFDFDSFDDDVTGDGHADRYGAYARKHFDFGLNLGATYSYSKGEIDAEDSVFTTAGKLDQTSHGFTLGVGYGRKFGEDTLGKNIAFDSSANFLYSNDDYDSVNGPPTASLTGSSEYETVWFSWRNIVSHNIDRRISVFASFTLHQRINADERDSVQSFFGAIPDEDQTIGQLGGGVVAILGKGLSAHAFARTDILNDIHSLVTAGIGLAYKF